jgi:peptidoglycan hydrolase CwlO-like protein
VVISRRFRLALVVSLFATLLLLAVPSIASASALAATKAQARTAAAQVAGLDRQLNQTVATYAAAMQRLTALQSQVAANRAALRLDSYQLTLSRQQLAENLVSAYKGGGASVLNAVFETGSFDDLLTRLDYVQQLTGSNAALVGAVQQHHRQVVAEQATLSKALKSAQQTATQLDAQRGRLNAQLGARRALLRGLNAAGL